MTRPRVEHDGFLVPNAGDVANPKMAEPDRIDFSTVGNNRWGVISGCLVTVSGGTAHVEPGIAVVNGVMVRVSAGDPLLGTAASQDRFDLVVAGLDGQVRKIAGTPGTDPVFPDPGVDATVLAAVFCPAGESSLVDYVIDKRNLLSDSLLTKIPPTNPLVQNLNGTGDHFRMNGDGHQTWEGDAHILRSAAETIKIIKHLILTGDLSVGGNTSTVNLTASGLLTGTNLTKSTAAPATPTDGDLWQGTTGIIKVWRDGEWEELATVSGAVPVGTIIQSLQGKTEMQAMGWYPLDGTPIGRDEDTENLFGLAALQDYIDDTGPTDILTLPDATGRVLITDFANPGKPGGTDEVTLSLANLPAHNHGIVMDPAGAHVHPVTVNQGGAHTHSTTSAGTHSHAVTDPGHRHGAAEGPGDVHCSVIAVVWGGQNKIDALFNDRSHTYSVEQLAWTKCAFSGITVGTTGSGHSHTVSTSPTHTHTATADGVPSHTHPLTVQTVGQGTAVKVPQKYLTVYTYIRS